MVVVLELLAQVLLDGVDLLKVELEVAVLVVAGHKHLDLYV